MGEVISRGSRVEAYWNLHRLCLSFRPMGGRVQHTEGLRLEDVSFVVQPAGRARVLKEKRKNVHAFLRGIFVEANNDIFAPRDSSFVVVRYNPYEAGHFVRVDTGERIDTAKEIVAVGKTIYARP